MTNAISIHALREEGDKSPCARHTTRTYFYPRPPRGGRRCGSTGRAAVSGISIHALREEGDREVLLRCRSSAISIHALREEGDRCSPMIATRGGISIHALREEGDLRPQKEGISRVHFYPRPPRGGRPSVAREYIRYRYISIHALREEGDLCGPPAPSYSGISIHALREEGDMKSKRTARIFTPISIHALREEGDIIAA